MAKTCLSVDFIVYSLLRPEPRSFFYGIKLCSPTLLKAPGLLVIYNVVLRNDNE